MSVFWKKAGWAQRACCLWFTFILAGSTGLSGCSRMPGQISQGTGAEQKKALDTGRFQHAVQSGKPEPFSDLKSGQLPEALRCEPVWESPPIEPEGYSHERIAERQGVTIKTAGERNGDNQTLWEYSCEDESTGQRWREYYIDRQPIYRGQPWSDSNFTLEWTGRGTILFWAENKTGFFFIFDIRRRIISLFHDSQWKHITYEGGEITNDMWQYYDPDMQVQLGGYEKDTGQILFYINHEHTTLFEYHPIRQNDITLLLDNLPLQKSMVTNYAGTGSLFQRRDGTIWFCAETGGAPGRNGMVFQYDVKTKVLTPVFDYSDGQACYFYKDSIAVHSWPHISIYDYNTKMVYSLEDCSQIYALIEIGPEKKECILTYSRNEKKNYLWDVSGNKRYYVTYDDIVKDFPDADIMDEGDSITYLYGEGRFCLERAEDDRLWGHGHMIDWYSSIHQAKADTAEGAIP